MRVRAWVSVASKWSVVLISRSPSRATEVRGTGWRRHEPRPPRSVSPPNGAETERETREILTQVNKRAARYWRANLERLSFIVCRSVAMNACVSSLTQGGKVSLHQSSGNGQTLTRAPRRQRARGRRDQSADTVKFRWQCHEGAITTIVSTHCGAKMGNKHKTILMTMPRTSHHRRAVGAQNSVVRGGQRASLRDAS